MYPYELNWISVLYTVSLILLYLVVFSCSFDCRVSNATVDLITQGDVELTALDENFDEGRVNSFGYTVLNCDINVFDDLCYCLEVFELPF